MGLILRHHVWNVGAGVCVLLVYVFVLSIMPRHVFWSPDEGGKFIELQTIQWHGGLTYVIPYADQWIDPAFKFYPHLFGSDGDPFLYPVAAEDGTVRFHWPIWFPLISGWMLHAFGLTGIYVIPLLSGWFIALVSGRLAYALKPRLAPLTIVLVGLATPVFFYSQCFWEHTLAAVLALVAVMVLATARHRSFGTAVAMSLPLFAASVLRIEMLAFAAAAVFTWKLTGLPSQGGSKSAIRVASWSRARARSIVLLGCAGFVALSVFATLSPRHQHLVSMFPTRAAAALVNAPHLPRSLASLFVNTARNEGPKLHPLWVTVTGVAIILCLVAPFVRSVRMEAVVIIPALLIVLVFSIWVAQLDQQYRSLHGIFPVAPFLVIAFYALPDAWRHRRRASSAVASVGFLYLVFGCGAVFVFYVNAEGALLSGLEWGQRYLLALYPVLTVLSVAALDAYRHSPRPVALKRAFTVLVSAMMILGVRQEIRGLAMLRVNRQMFAAWDQALRSDGPIVTSLWWLPATLAPLFVTKGIAYVRSPQALAEWTPLAAAHGIAQFTFVSLAPIPDRQLATAGRRQRLRDSRFVSGMVFTRFDVIDIENPAAPP